MNVLRNLVVHTRCYLFDKNMKILSTFSKSSLFEQNFQFRSLNIKPGHNKSNIFSNPTNLLKRPVISQNINISQLFHNEFFYSVKKFSSSPVILNFNRNAVSKKENKSTMYYMAALVVLCLGLSYAAVPLYRIFCQAYSYGGTVQEGHDAAKVEDMVRVQERIIQIRFNADISSAMTWNFKPQQSEIKLSPGETALAFYTAKNPTDKPVIGVSTYNVLPFEAGQYFNKIQCFCFEEQMLNPNEEVHMPVFFYIDPEFVDDPKMQGIDIITLSYTFFEAKDGLQIPIPSYART